MTTTILESEGDIELTRSDKMLATRLDTAVQALEAKQEEFATYLQELKAREDEVAELKKKLYQQMTDEGVRKLETNRLLITTVNPKPRHSIDTKKLQAINPALFAQVDAIAGKDTNVSGYVKITVKEDK